MGGQWGAKRRYLRTGACLQQIAHLGNFCSSLPTHFRYSPRSRIRSRTSQYPHHRYLRPLRVLLENSDRSLAHRFADMTGGVRRAPTFRLRLRMRSVHPCPMFPPAKPFGDTHFGRAFLASPSTFCLPFVSVSCSRPSPRTSFYPVDLPLASAYMSDVVSLYPCLSLVCLLSSCSLYSLATPSRPPHVFCLLFFFSGFLIRGTRTAFIPYSFLSLALHERL